MNLIHNWIYSSSTAATNYNFNTDMGRIKFKAEGITEELKTIAKEEEEDKEKYLPIFDIKDLDI